MLQKQALWDWGFRQLQREHAAEASSVGLGLQTVAEIASFVRLGLQTVAENMLQKQALWDWGFRQLQREHAAEASTVGLGLQTVAEITSCRNKLCGTGALDSFRENMLQKHALWDWGFTKLCWTGASASSVGLGHQTVAERTCCRSKLCGTGA